MVCLYDGAEGLRPSLPFQGCSQSPPHVGCAASLPCVPWRVYLGMASPALALLSRRVPGLSLWQVWLSQRPGGLCPSQSLQGCARQQSVLPFNEDLHLEGATVLLYVLKSHALILLSVSD